MARSPLHFFCAFCRTPRSIKNKKHIGLFEVSVALLGSLCLMFLFFHKFDMRFFPIFSIFVVIAETIIQFSYRLSLACPHCGFDPLVYKRSPEKAALVVKEYLENKKKDPLTILKEVPYPDLPKKPKNPNIDRTLTKSSKTKNTPSHKAKNLDIQL